jgi:phospholipase A-2-activating protein
MGLCVYGQVSWWSMDSQCKLTISEKELLQSIPHPSLSLWSTAVIPTPSGKSYYIASSSSDSTIRVFTNDEELMAPAEEKAVWDKDVAGRKLDK